MTIEQILATQNLERTVLIGYYGGGNYGDELLLEVLAGRLKSHGVKKVTITYQDPSRYAAYHHSFGYPLVPMHDKLRLLRAIISNKNIVIGGGGLWGLDVNPNILLLSVLLFAARWLLGKKVYLLGVGYYGSTSRTGRISAWLAGKSAAYIVARDLETFDNFRRINSRLSLDTDIAWLISRMDLRPYKRDLARLDAALPVTRKTLFVTLRRFKPRQANRYAELIEQYLQSNERPVIVALMEPHGVDPAGYSLIRRWQHMYKHVRIIDFSWNPLALFLFFQKHRHKLALVGPQFHVIITAYLNGVPFLPVAYDNKVSQLLEYIGQGNAIPIQALTQNDVQMFSRGFYEGAS